MKPLLIGESLTPDTPAGKLLDRMLSRRTDPETSKPLSREDFQILSLPKPALLPYPEEVIEPYATQIIKTLEAGKPGAIIACGDQAFRWFTGEWGVTKLRGYIFETRRGPVIGTYHPEYIRRGKFPYTKPFQQDLLKGLYVVRHGVPKATKHYDLRPSPEAVAGFWNRYQTAGFPLLSWDIETPYSKGQKDEKDDALVTEKFLEDDPSYRIILRISFSYEPFRAITMPWTRPYTDYIKLLLESKGDKLVWNKHFDVPRVGAHGVRTAGRIYDGMDAFHFLEPSLPMGLKSAATYYCPDMHAWKLDSRDQPEWYNAADSDVALRCFLGIRDDLTKQGRWEIFEKHFVDLSGVLGRMSTRGVLVDRAQRALRREEFEDRLGKGVAALQDSIPLALRKKKIFKLTEERLRKEGKWQEERMTQVTVLEPWKEPKVPKPPKVRKVRVKRGASTPEPGPNGLASASPPAPKESSTGAKPKRAKKIKPVMESVALPPRSSMVS